MEKVSVELKLAELKKDNIRKTLDNLQSQSSSLLLFTVQWRDLEDHFDSIQKWIEEHSEEVELKEKHFDSIQKSNEDRSKEVESKEKHLELVRKSIEERAEEVESEHKRLDFVQISIKERSKELESKENQFELVQKMIQESVQELELKEKNFKLFQISLEERSQEVDLKEKRLDSVQKSVEERCKELELKEKKFEVFRRLVEERSEEVESKEKRMDSIQKLNDERCEDLKMKEKQIDAMQKLVEKRSEELDLKEEQFNSMQSSIKKLSEELGSKEEQFNSIKISIEESSKELESKQGKLNLIQKLSKECLRQLQLKEKQFDSINKLFEERSKDLESKEKQLDSVQKAIEECCKEPKLKEKKMVSIQNTVGEGSNTIQSQVKSEPLEVLPVHSAMDCSLFADLRFCITMGGKSLQFFLNKCLNEHELMRDEVSTAFRMSSDPAKLVLDAMQGFYPPHSKEGDVEFEASVIRRSCILLLEQLMCVSPQINPRVKEEALKLAGEWRAKMRVETENSLEVLGFLQLLATYGLASAFVADDLLHLLGTVAQHRQAPELRRALGFADKIPVSYILHSQVKIEQPEYVMANNPIDSSSMNVQFCDTMDGRSMQLFLNDHLNKHDLTHDEVFAALQMSLDPAKLVLDVIQGFYPPHLKKGGMDFESSARSCIVLLEQLMRISPEIEPQVKEEAMKIAVEWKAKMRVETENSLEVFVFLQLLATYGLVSTFNGDEILKLLEIVAQHGQTPDLCRALGFADKIPDFIKHLVEKQQWLEAIRYSHAFELVDKFPPVPFLDAQLKFSKEVAQLKFSKDVAKKICKEGNYLRVALDEAAEKESDALRAIIKCIADYKLESEYSLEDLEKRIAQLEKRKAERRLTAPSPAPSPKALPQKQSGNKRPRTVVSSQSAPNTTTAGMASTIHPIQPPSRKQAYSSMNPRAQYSRRSVRQRGPVTPHTSSLHGHHSLAATPPSNRHRSSSAWQHGVARTSGGNGLSTRYHPFSKS